jgi:hypothetical protein
MTEIIFKIGKIISTFLCFNMMEYANTNMLYDNKDNTGQSIFVGESVYHFINITGKDATTAEIINHVV